MEEKSPIGSLLSQLREFNMENKEVVDNLLREAQKLFGLGDELDIISLDAFLIQAIMYHVFGSKGEPAQIDKAHAVKRDTYLLALGLLDGYYHIKNDGSYYTASERHKQYLTDSDYMKLSRFKPSDNLDIDYAQSAPRRRLSTADKRCREKLESLLSDNKKCKKCLEEGKEKYIKKSKNGKKYIDLPKLYYTLDNFPPKDVKAETEYSTNGDTDPVPISVRMKMEKLIKYLRMRFRTKDVVIILILLFMAGGIWETAQSLRSRNTEATNSTAMTENEALTITGITIHNADITLSPDKPWEQLRVSIYPREANIDDVNYNSDNPHLVTVNRNTERVRLASEWEKQTEQSTKVHVQFEEIDAEALISVQGSQAGSTASPGESSLGGNNSDEAKNTSGF